MDAGKRIPQEHTQATLRLLCRFTAVGITISPGRAVREGRLLLKPSTWSEAAPTSHAIIDIHKIKGRGCYWGMLCQCRAVRSSSGDRTRSASRFNPVGQCVVRT